MARCIRDGSHHRARLLEKPRQPTSSLWRSRNACCDRQVCLRSHLRPTCTLLDRHHRPRRHMLRCGVGLEVAIVSQVYTQARQRGIGVSQDSHSSSWGSRPFTLISIENTLPLFLLPVPQTCCPMSQNPSACWVLIFIVFEVYGLISSRR